MYVLLHHWTDGTLSRDHKLAILATLDYLLQTCESATSPGHYYSSTMDPRVTVHWCHGATGAVFLWTKAHQVLCESPATCTLSPSEAGTHWLTTAVYPRWMFAHAHSHTHVQTVPDTHSHTHVQTVPDTHCVTLTHTHT